MNRETAYQILMKYLTNRNLIKHSLAAEATMRALARSCNENEEVWGITGLLHDADYEMSKGHPEQHGLILFEKEPNSIPPDIAHAIKSHNFTYTNVLPETKLDWAITCCDQLTGLIVAAALVHPDRKLQALTVDFIMKRLKQKDFAKGADRKPIYLCREKLGIPLENFISIALSAMQEISNQLEL
jgi:predicted hydrolase (HD superfamily)